MSEMSLPKHWEVEKLGDKAELKNGINFKKEQKGQGILTVDVLNMYSDGIYLDTGNLYRVDYKIKDRDLLRANDILFVRSSLKQEGVAWASLFRGHEEPMTFCGFLIRARLTTPEINHEFLTHYFRTDFARRFLVSKSARLAITNISQATLSTCPIPLPPLPEQRAIAHVLQTIQEAKSTRQREIALERERKAALMDYLFSYGTKGEPRKQTEIGEIPESWEVRTIDEICERIIDYRGRTPKFSESGIVHLRSSNVKEGRLILKADEITYVTDETYKSFMTRGFPKAGDVMFTTEGPLGESAMVPPNFRFSLAQRMILLRSDETVLDSSYLLYALYSEQVRKEYLRRATGSTAKGISSKNFQQVQVPLPCLLEQRKIATVLTACDTKITALEQETDRLEELFHAMLHELMTGQRSAVPLLESEMIQ